jgi:hypothetical protein
VRRVVLAAAAYLLFAVIGRSVEGMGARRVRVQRRVLVSPSRVEPVSLGLSGGSPTRIFLDTAAEQPRRLRTRTHPTSGAASTGGTTSSTTSRRSRSRCTSTGSTAAKATSTAGPRNEPHPCVCDARPRARGPGSGRSGYAPATFSGARTHAGRERCSCRGLRGTCTEGWSRYATTARSTSVFPQVSAG